VKCGLAKGDRSLPCRIVGRVFVHRVRGSDAGDEDRHRLVVRHCEVGPIRGLSVDGTDGQRTQALICRIAMVCCDLRIGADLQQLGVDSRLGCIAL
jgi:hypothetical protein